MPNSLWSYQTDQYGVEYTNDGKELVKFPSVFNYTEYKVLPTCEKISKEAIYTLNFINSCTGEDFCKRNTHLEIKKKEDILWAKGTMDKRVYISNTAAIFLKEYMSVPNADLKRALSHCGFCCILSKENTYKKIDSIIYNRQENYQVFLSKIIIPIKTATAKTVSMLLSIFNMVCIALEDEKIIELTANQYNKEPCFHSPTEKEEEELQSRASSIVDLEWEEDKQIDEYGACYSQDGKTLLSVPTNLSFYIVKKETKNINLYAFNNCENLSLVLLPQGIKCLGPCCFSGCKQLSYIYLPDTITDICENVFSNCNSLRNLEYPKHLNYLSFDIHDLPILESIKMPLSVEEINVFNGTLLNCGSLKKILIPRGQQSKYSNLFSWIKWEIFIKVFQEYIEEGCIPGKDISYEDLAIDYCKLFHVDWNKSSYFKYELQFIKEENGVYYYKPSREPDYQWVWQMCYDSEETEATIKREEAYNPFLFENSLIAVEYTHTYSVNILE